MSDGGGGRRGGRRTEWFEAGLFDDRGRGEGNVLDRWPALGAGTQDGKAKLERDTNCVTPTNMGKKETVRSLSLLVRNFQHRRSAPMQKVHSEWLMGLW